MNKINMSGILLIGVAGALIWSSQAVAAKEEAVAQVNGKSISAEYLDKKYHESLQFYQSKVPTKKSVLDDLIKRELGIQEAVKEGLNKDPEVIDKTNTVLYHAFLEKKLAKDFEKISVSDDDAQSYYLKNPEIRTSHIFVAIPPDATSEQEQAALEKIKKIEGILNEGKLSFSEVAQAHSEGVEAAMGGDVDYQGRDRLEPAYYEAALKLKNPGKISGPVRTRFGFHLIKLTAIRSWKEADKGKVKRTVFEKKREEVFERYMSQLRKDAKVTINNQLLKE